MTDMIHTMPTWEGFMVPVLQVLSDGEVRNLRALRRDVSVQAGLDDELMNETLASGQGRAANRIGWAGSYLTRIDAITRPSRGHYQISDLGLRLLAEHPDGLTENDLKPHAKDGDEWWTSTPRTTGVDKPAAATTVDATTALDPIEQIDHGIERIRSDVAAELLARLGDEDPGFFEQAVVDLLMKMGYGGSGGSGVATGLVHDGGIDGVINQDVLGLDKVYIQAKRYAPGNGVQRPEVQAFVGALSGKADAGVFITTSGFSSGAIEYAESAHTRVILVDGRQLTDLMIDYEVGVQVGRTVKIVDIDEDFFT